MIITREKELELRNHAWDVIRTGATLDREYIIMNVFATILACYGLLSNSPVVVIGAMVVALLLGPIMASALALVEGDNIGLYKGVYAEFVGIGIVYTVALILGFIHRDMPITKEILSRTAPNFIDLIIALTGGAAGVCALIIPRLSSSLIGVAIATALVPPLASSAILMAHGEYSLAAGAFLLAFTNMIAIQFASFLVIIFFRYSRKSLKPKYLFHVVTRNLVSTGILLILGFFLFFQLRNVMETQAYKLKVHSIIQNSLKKFDGNYLVKLGIQKKRTALIIRAVIEGPQALTPDDVGLLEAQLPPAPKKLPIDFRVRFIHTIVTTSQGELYKNSEK